MAEHSDLRSLAVDHVIEADDLEPRKVHDLHGDALLRVRLGVRVREHEALPRRAVREVEEVVEDVAVNHDDGVASARDQVSVPHGHLLRHVEAQEQVRLKVASQDRAASTFSSMSSMSSSYTSTRRSRAAERTLRREVGPLAQELSSPKERRSSTHRPSTGRIPRGNKVKLRVQREVQLSAVQCSDSPAWSPALALTAVALVLGAVLAGLSKSKMSPRQRVVLRQHGVLVAVHPGGEVDQPSQRPPPGVQHSVPSFALVLGAVLPASKSNVSAAPCRCGRLRCAVQKAGRGGLSLTPASCADIVAAHRSPL